MAERFGLTWWGERWIAALEALGAAYANRLPRGRTYARRGAVRNLQVGVGSATASVHGSRPQPYLARLEIPVFTDPQWTSLTEVLAGQLRTAALLLGGQMPTDIDETAGSVGLSLFPAPGELVTRCSCPDFANPCKHIAALHYLLAKAFDDDPFLLTTLRGRRRTELLTGIRAARSAGGRTAARDGHTDRAGSGGGRTGNAGDRARSGGGAARLPAKRTGQSVRGLSASSMFDAVGDLAAIVVHPQPVQDPAAPLRRLPPPPGFGSHAELADLAVRAAERAWRFAGRAAAEPVGSAGHDG